jgi:hypothetical protein
MAGKPQSGLSTVGKACHRLPAAGRHCSVPAGAAPGGMRTQASKGDTNAAQRQCRAASKPSSKRHSRRGETAGGGLQQQASMPLAKARGLPPLLLVGLAVVSCMSSSAAATPASPAAFAAQGPPPNCGSGSCLAWRRLASAPPATSIPAAAPASAWAASAARAAVASGQAAGATSALMGALATVSPIARRRCLGAGLRSVGKAVLMSAA